jgi:hypothetical protein
VTTVRGTAQNCKAGAVIVTTDGDAVYVEGLSCWPDEVLGKPVTATGTLVHEKFIPDPQVDERGAISQGAHGTQTVLKGARWSV